VNVVWVQFELEKHEPYEAQKYDRDEFLQQSTLKTRKIHTKSDLFEEPKEKHKALVVTVLRKAEHRVVHLAGTVHTHEQFLTSTAVSAQKQLDAQIGRDWDQGDWLWEQQRQSALNRRKSKNEWGP
jgi:hypothetical protein